MGLLSTIGSASGRAFGLTRLSAAIKDTYFNLVTLLLPGNGTNGAQNNTFLDSSTNNFTITRNGNTTQGTFSPFSQTGWSNFFDGSGDYLNNSTLDATFTGDFTFEGWVFVSTYTNPTVFFGIGSETTNRMMFGITNSGQLFANYFGQAGNFTWGSTGNVTLNTWHHVAFVRSSSNINAYLNGVAQGTAASYSTTVGNTGGIGIGAMHNGSYQLTGYMSNVRYTAQALYTSTFTPSTTALTTTSQGATASNVKVLSCQDNRFKDNSNSPITLTVNGNPSVQAFSPFAPTAAYSASTIGGSGYFDGSGDNLTTSTNVSIGTQAFTYELFIYFTASPQGYLIGQGTSGGAALFYEGGTLGLARAFTGNDLTFSTTFAQNTWHHIVAVRSGTGTNQTAFFINGTRVATGTVTSNYSTSSFYVGGVSGATFVTGYISNARIVVGTAVYDPTLTTLTVPTAPLTAITNTSFLARFTNAGITDATAKNVLETVGNAQISTTQSKFGGGSLYFDGTGDYLLQTANMQNYVFGTGDFTIEYWLYLNVTNVEQGILGFRPQETNGAYPVFYFLSGTLRYNVNSADRISASVSSGIWYHVAVSRSGTSTRMFLNGVQQGSTYSDSTNYLASRLAIGANDYVIGTNGLNGYIDDLRITKGYARYTANFTAPSSAFELQ